MSDGLMLSIGDDGIARAYDDTYDITIHCESRDEQEEARKALESIPRWIPCSERLPKSKEEDFEYPTVLITFENDEILLGCFYESTKEWGTGEYFDEKCFPIAWMPLPEPYKGVTT